MRSDARKRVEDVRPMSGDERMVAEVLCHATHPDEQPRAVPARSPRLRIAACFSCQRIAAALAAAGIGVLADERERIAQAIEAERDRAFYRADIGSYFAVGMTDAARIARGTERDDLHAKSSGMSENSDTAGEDA